MRLYIAGPMTGLPEYNYPAFARAKELLLRAGYDAVSPHEILAMEPTVLGFHLYNLTRNLHDHCDPPPEDEQDKWRWYLRRTKIQLLTCEGMALLEGWDRSRGVAAEIHLAETIGMPYKHIELWLSTPTPFSPSENRVRERDAGTPTDSGSRVPTNPTT